MNNILQFHDVSNLFPLMQGEEYEQLKNDIAHNGLIEPIWLHPDESIIDGRNRYRACNDLKIEPKFRKYQGDVSATKLISFVISLNRERRHLTSSQLAACAVEAEDLLTKLESEARERQGERIDLTLPNFLGNVEKHEGESTQQAAVLFSTNRQYVQDAKKLKKESPALFEKVKNDKYKIPDAKRLAKLPKEKRAKAEQKLENKEARNVKDAVRKVEREEQIQTIQTTPLPQGKYYVLVVDPPWHYDNRPTDITHRGALPYPSMQVDEISNIPIGDFSHDDCILWLWTTNAFMYQAHVIANNWGFKVKTILTWVKSKMGVGDWLRGKTEHCLMCVKGKPIVNLTNQTTVIYGLSREHSRKPDEFFEMVNQLCPGSKIEFYSREKREGWMQYGNETDKF